MSIQTRTPLNMNDQLAEAQTQARQLREELDVTESELAQALEATDYRAADAAKQRAEDLRPHVLLAEANVAALTNAVNALQEHVRQGQATAVEQARQERLTAAHAAVHATEREAIEASERLLAEARASVNAAQATLRAALAAEQDAGTARVQAHQIAVEAGWEQPSAFGVSEPNLVKATLEASALLTQIFRAGA